MFQLGYLGGIIVLHGDVHAAILQGLQFRGCSRVPIRGNGQGIVANQKGGDELLLVLRFQRQNGVPKLLRERFQMMSGPDELQIGQKEVLAVTRDTNRNNIPDEQNVQRILHRFQTEKIRFAERNAPHFELHALEHILWGGGSHVFLIEHVHMAEKVLRIQIFPEKPDQIRDFEKRLDLWNSKNLLLGNSYWSAASNIGSISPKCPHWEAVP